MQGNWGNLLTGDSAAAPRYIEARLTPFALEVIFSPKVTHGHLPMTGEIKNRLPFQLNFLFCLHREQRELQLVFPQRFLPHNFNEILDA